MSPVQPPPRRTIGERSLRPGPRRAIGCRVRRAERGGGRIASNLPRARPGRSARCRLSLSRRSPPRRSMAAPEQHCSPEQRWLWEQTMPAERASMGVPTDAAPSAASAPAEGRAPDSPPTEPPTEPPRYSGAPENPRSAAPENLPGAAPEHPRSAAAEDAHDAAPGEDPVPPSRRAQPMVIASDTLSGPIESEAADEDSEDSQPVIADSPDADTENDRDFSPDHDFILASLPPETAGGEPDSARKRNVRAPHPAALSCAITRSRRSSVAVRSCWAQVVKEERAAPKARR